MINLNRIIKNTKGEETPFSFPKTEKEKEKKETVGNIILNCLAIYPVKVRRDIFSVNSIANKILVSGENNHLSFSQVELDFLKDVLFEGTFRTEGQGEERKEKGLYLAISIGQVFEEIGIIEN